MFGEKSTVCAENNFSSLDLLNFVASLLRSSRIYERRFYRSNYSWLSTRNIDNRSLECDLDEFKPLVRKLTSESCASVAVKLQVFAEDLNSSSSILTAFKNILEEQYSIQMMVGGVKREKDGKGKRQNKVRPILTPPGRQATVSFILN